MTIRDKALYDTALSYAAEMHSGQKRKGGEPYIVHPIAVAEMLLEKGYGIAYAVSALFHDLLEDTDADEKTIEEIGGKEVLTAVKLLTKPKNYVMSEYTSGIEANPIAYAVKGADRLDNLRSAYIADDDFKRRYIIETQDWYLDYLPEIPSEVIRLARTMKAPPNISRAEAKAKL